MYLQEFYFYIKAYKKIKLQNNRVVKLDFTTNANNVSLNVSL